MGASIGITVGVNGESEYVRSLENITAQTKAFQSELKEVQSAFDSTNDLGGQWAKSESILTNEIDVQKERIGKLTKELEEAKKNYGENSTEVYSLEKQLNTAGTALHAMEKQLANGNIPLLNQAASETKLWQSELSKVQSSFTDKTSSWTKSTSTAAVLNEGISAQKENIRLLEDQVARVGAAYGETSQQCNEWKIKLNEANTELNRMQNELDNLPNRVQALGEDWEKSGKKLQDSGRNVSKVGDTLSMFSAPIAGALAYSVKAAGDFEESMDRIRAISGATDEEMANIEDKARELARTTRYTAEEVGEAMYYYALAGQKPQEIMDGVAASLNLASAGGTDLSISADMLTDALAAFNQEASQADHFADVIAATVTNSNTDVDKLANGYKYITPVIGTLYDNTEDLNTAFTDMNVVLGVMANSSVKDTVATTALRNILTNMANPVGQSKEAFDKLGVTLDDGEGHVVSILSVFEQLRDSFGTLKIPVKEFELRMNELDQQLEDGVISEKEYDKQQEALIESAYGAEGALKAKYAAMLGGKRGMSGLLAVMNTAPDKFYEVADAIYDSAGAAETMREIMEDNLPAQWDIFKAAVNDLAISFGQTMLPTLIDFVHGITDVVNGLNGMDDGTRKVIIGAGLFIAAVGPILSVGGRIITGIGTLEFGAGKLLQVIGGISGAKGVGAVVAGSKETVGALGAVKTAIGASSGAGVIGSLGSLASAFAPFLIGGAVVALLGLGVYEIVKHWDTIKEKAGELKEKISKKWEEIKENTSKTVKDIKKSVGDGWENLKKNTKETWDNLITKVSESWNNMKKDTDENSDNIKTTIGIKWEEIKTNTKDTWDKVKTKISESWTNLKKDTKDATDNMKKEIGTKWENIKTDTATKWDTIKRTVTSAAENMRKESAQKINEIKTHMTTTFETLKSNATSWGSGIVGNLKNSIESRISWVKDAASNVGGAIKDGITGTLSKAWDWGVDMMANLSQSIWQKMSWVTDAASSVASKIKGFLGFSLPDYGPLSDADTYMPDMMKLLAGGIYKNMGLINRASETLAAALLPDIDTGKIIKGSGNMTTITHGDTVLNIYGAAGQDVNELADVVIEKLTMRSNRQMVAYG